MIKEFVINLVKHYGSIAVFFSLIIEYLGIPVPGETTMSFIGFLNWKSPGAGVFSSIIFAVAGTFIGSNIAWLLGSVIWCITFIGMGSLLGNQWTTIGRLIRAYSLILILLAVFVLIVIKFFGRHKKIIFVIAFPTFLFIKLIEDLIKKELSVFDNAIYGYLKRWISEDMTDWMKWITSLGAGWALILISAASLWLFRRNKKYAYFSRMIGLNLILVSVLNEIFKDLFHRARPDILRLVQAGGFSFPSGHSMISIAFYGYIGYLVSAYIQSRWKYLIIALLPVLVLFIGISRVYLGVHYASDVVAGFSAGLAWLAVFITLSNRFYFLKSRP